MTFHDDMAGVVSELSTVASGIDEAPVMQACRMIRDAHRIMLYGCGREGLQMQGFATRLHHLGLSIAMQGDMAAPPIRKRDLFIASAGPGDLATVTALMGQAKAGGAQVLFLTAQKTCDAAALVDHIVHIPAQTMADDRDGGASTLPMGSLYEGAMFVLFEAMILTLIQMLGETAESIRARHTNME